MERKGAQAHRKGVNALNAPSPETIYTLLAELIAKQQGRVVRDIRIMKKEGKQND